MYYLGEDEASVLRHARAHTHTHTHTRTHAHLELEIWKHNTIQDFVYEQQKWKSAQRAHIQFTHATRRPRHAKKQRQDKR